MLSLNDRAIQEISSKVIRPTNPQELLSNLKFALDQDLLIHIEFYTKENLEHFFGGQAQIHMTKPPEGDFEMHGEITDGVFSNPKQYRGMDVNFYLKREIEAKGNLHAIVVIPGTVADPRITVNSVESVFSSGTERVISDSNNEVVSDRIKNANPKGPAPFVGYRSPTTNEQGNKNFDFLYPSTAATKSSISFITFAGGDIKNIVINQLEK